MSSRVRTSYIVRPIIVALFLLPTTASALIFGYKFALFGALFSFAIWLITARRFSPLWGIAGILLASSFDNPAFNVNFGEFKGIRPQTPFAILLVIGLGAFLLALRGLPKKLCILIVLAVLICAYNFMHTSTMGFAYAIKYWLLYWLPAIAVYLVATREIDGATYFYSILTITIVLYGFIQFFANVYPLSQDIRSSLQLDWVNIYPSAFFSERTWYGEAAVLALPMITMHLQEGKISRIFYYFAILSCVLAIVLSHSRNPIIVFTIWFFLSLILKNTRRTLSSIGPTILCLISIFFGSLYLIEHPAIRYLRAITDRLIVSDPSGIGRIEAARMMIQRYAANPSTLLVGSGFDWTQTEFSSTGTAIGSKSANIIDFITSIFGLPFLVFQTMLFLSAVIRRVSGVGLSSENSAGLILVVMWLSMAQFAPLHQYGFTVFSLAIGMAAVFCRQVSPRTN